MASIQKQIVPLAELKSELVGMVIWLPTAAENCSTPVRVTGVAGAVRDGSDPSGAVIVARMRRSDWLGVLNQAAGHNLHGERRVSAQDVRGHCRPGAADSEFVKDAIWDWRYA